MFKVLKKKEYDLITPHDIHATLKDILEVCYFLLDGVARFSGPLESTYLTLARQSADAYRFVPNARYFHDQDPKKNSANFFASKSERKQTLVEQFRPPI